MESLMSPHLAQALRSYASVSRHHAAATIALAVAANVCRREIEAPEANSRSARRFVLRGLSIALEDKSLASRILDIGDLADRLVALGLRLDAVRSQGVLFALVVAAKFFRWEPRR